jgi:two-component system, LuxR family, response regulator FixJ
VAINNLVCVVDDDPSMARMLGRGIRAAGLDVVVFTSAEELLESCRLEDAACLVLDNDLPGMTGIDLLKRLSESGSEVPVIMISGQTNDHISNRALTAGAFAFFKKPFRIESLLAAIQNLEPQMSL